MKNKIKSKKALMKRIKQTATGKILRHSAYTSHLSRSKTHKQKKQLAKGGMVSKGDYKRIKKLLR